MAKESVPLPDGVEERLVEITELVATAVASSATREQLTRLAGEQAALRRVATLVARGAAPADVFDAVTEELGGFSMSAPPDFSASKTSTRPWLLRAGAGPVRSPLSAPACRSAGRMS